MNNKYKKYCDGKNIPLKNRNNTESATFGLAERESNMPGEKESTDEIHKSIIKLKPLYLMTRKNIIYSISIIC